jgi:hypothetical protein
VKPKLSIISLAIASSLAASACKGKDKDAGGGKRAGSAASAAQPADRGPWLSRLPEVGDGGLVGLQLSSAAGLVEIRADGSVRVAQAPSTTSALPSGALSGPPQPDLSTEPAGPGTPSPLASARAAVPAEVAGALGLPAVAQRTPSVIGSVDGAAPADSDNPIDALFARLGHPEPALGAPPPPARLTKAFAIAHPHDVTAGVIVFADAQAPARVLVDVLAQTGGFVAIRKADTLGALPYAFDRAAPPTGTPDQTWTEARLRSGGDAQLSIEVETVPGVPAAVPAIDVGEVITATGAKAVDVLVGPNTTVADVVRTLDQLRVAKLEAVGLGLAPAADSPDASARGSREIGPRVLAWNLDMVEVDPTVADAFQAALAAALEPIRACYQAALGKTHDLAGTAQLQVIVAPGSNKAAADVIGLPPQLTSCVTSTIKATPFPKAPQSGARATARLAFFAR